MLNRYIFLYFFFLGLILFSCGEDKMPEKITYSEHIAPIIYKNCTSCHRPGEAGPFNLITYKDAIVRKDLIKKFTQSRFMPPWPADADYTHFVDQKVLTQKEIDLIARWVDEGCSIGDSTKMPPLPVFPQHSQLGTPDLVIKFKKSYFIKGNAQDQFLLMRVPYEIPIDTFVRAIEVVPGNRKVVHHVNAQLLSYEFDKRKDVFAGNTVVDLNNYPDKLQAYNALNLPNDDGSYPLLTQSVANYLPGVLPTIYPEEIGGYKFTRKGALFLKDMHYGPSREDTYDSTVFNVFYSKRPPKRPIQEFQMGTFGLSPIVPPLVVPPDEVKTFHSKYTVPFDISILTINPHMHLLGKSFWAYAYTVQGDTIPLIRIKKWDFRWQYFYTFKKMIKIPKGATIVVEAVFDNTRNNPFNPYNPSRLIAEREGSMRTSDEMLQFIISYLPYQTGDENISLENTEYLK